MRTDDAEAARRAVDRAAALAPESPDTRKARGRYAHVVQGNATAALAEYQAALRAAPNRSDLLDAAASAEIDLGLWTEALSHLEHATKIDPQSAEVFGDLGSAYTRVRRYAEARAALERARGLRPSSMSLAHTRARLAASQGDLEGIRQVYRSMEEIVGRRRVVAYVALRQDLIWALNDDGQRAEPALDRLEQLVDQPGIMSRDFLRIDPNFEPLRTHPRFVRLISGGDQPPLDPAGTSVEVRDQ